MKFYKLISIDNNKEVTSREDVLDIVLTDAIVDLRDGYCLCYRCDKEYDLAQDDETDDFIEHHTLTATLGCINLYRCYKSQK